MIKPPICPYCGKPAELVTGNAIYPHRRDLHCLKFWQCTPCEAYVGCHKGGGGIQPLGRLADAELRAAKSAAHRAFDPIWREGALSRRSAYDWLAKELNLTPQECHIGMFNVVDCKRVIAAAMRYDLDSLI